MKAAFSLLLLTFSLVYANVARSLSTEEFINEINSAQSLWTAGKNYMSDMSPEQFRQRLGLVKNPNTQLNYIPIEHVKDVPEYFDAREQWPDCSSIREIADQSSCGSCWAVSSASSMSDRLCIASGQKDQTRVSARDIIGCCIGMGCMGGEPADAWKYWETNGVTTGGLFNSSVGCQPYPFFSCRPNYGLGDLPYCPNSMFPTPECTKKCDTSNTYTLTFGQSSTGVKGEADIQQHLLQHGPLVCNFNAYEDFRFYVTGIYKYVKGNFEGGHSVRVIGWGVDRGVKYWLVANSWNDEWGDNGVFKMLRGTNECDFEADCSAGLAKL